MESQSGSWSIWPSKSKDCWHNFLIVLCVPSPNQFFKMQPLCSVFSLHLISIPSAVCRTVASGPLRFVSGADSQNQSQQAFISNGLLKNSHDFMLRLKSTTMTLNNLTILRTMTICNGYIYIYLKFLNLFISHNFTNGGRWCGGLNENDLIGTYWIISLHLLELFEKD